jgi:hypothetical protein
MDNSRDEMGFVTFLQQRRKERVAELLQGM